MQQWRRERESKRFTKIPKKPLGKKARLNRCPGKSGRWAQIPAGPVVPAQRAVLPPYVRQPATVHRQKKTNPQERKNKGDEHKATPNLDPQGSPHLEENLIGGMVDLDLLS